MKFNLFLVVVTLFFFTSCSFETTTHFNKDFSGETSTIIDLSNMAGFANMLQDEKGGKNELDSLFHFIDGKGIHDSIRNQIDTAKMLLHDAGMKNMQVMREGEESIKISYSFDDLSVFDTKKMSENLNNSIQQFDKSTEGTTELLDFLNTQSIHKEGKWLIIDIGGSTIDSLKEDLKDENIDDAMMPSMLQSMGDMFKTKSTFTFDRKVKQVISPFDYVSDKHKVIINYTMKDVFQLIKDGEPVELRVKLR